MRLSCALLASYDTPKTSEMWPIVKKAWWEIVGIPCIIVYIADTVPEGLRNDPAVIHFKPIKGMPHSLQAQEVCQMYPALLKGDGGILITDIDSIPVSSSEQVINVINYTTQAPIVCAVSPPSAWARMYGIQTIEDIYSKLTKIINTTIKPQITIINSDLTINYMFKLYNISQNELKIEATDLFVFEVTNQTTEAEVLQTKEVIFPKKILIWQSFSQNSLIEQVCKTHSIPFLKFPDEIQVTATTGEKTATHYALLENKIDTLFRKTAVLVWKTSFTNAPQTSRDNFWGLGDMLRGVIGVYKLSKKYNFDLIVDKSLHPLSMLLKSDPHRYSTYIKNNQDSIGLCMPYEVESLLYENLINNPKNDCACFYSNMPLESYDGEITDELRRFIDYVFRPIPSFEAYMNQMIKELALDSYTILHYRMGDDEMVRKQCNYAVYENAYQHLIQTYKSTDIVMSDSAEFKALIRKKNVQIRVLDTKICHVGLECSYEALRDTLFEFNLLRGAKFIRSYSRYSWVSGFVYAAHKIYNIPLEGQCDMKF
jgi:hypothetical protein